MKLWLLLLWDWPEREGGSERGRKRKGEGGWWIFEETQWRKRRKQPGWILWWMLAELLVRENGGEQHEIPIILR